MDEGKLILLVGGGLVVGIVHWDVYVSKLCGLLFLFQWVIGFRIQRLISSAIIDELLVYEDFEVFAAV